MSLDLVVHKDIAHYLAVLGFDCIVNLKYFVIDLLVFESICLHFVWFLVSSFSITDFRRVFSTPVNVWDRMLCNNN